VLALAIDSSLILDLFVVLVPMILSLSVHEYAHAWVAYRLGDDTAAREGRLTLNPLAHIDVIGTLLIPICNVLFAGGFTLIGWAKPVPVRPLRFTRKVTMRTGMALTAVAGPLSNLALAIISIGVAALLLRTVPEVLMTESSTGSIGPSGIAILLRSMFAMNIGLCVFNLVPIPPLDGSRLLPRSMDGYIAAVTPYSFLLVLVIINFSVLRENLLYKPVMLVASVLQFIFQTRVI